MLAFSGILVSSVLFVSLPLEEGYSIPVVVFVILTVGALVERRLVVLAYALIMISPFAGVSTGRVFEGPVRIGYRDRSRIPAEVEEIVDLGPQLTSTAFVSRPDSLEDPQGRDAYYLRPGPGGNTLGGGFVYPQRDSSVRSSRTPPPSTWVAALPIGGPANSTLPMEALSS